MREDMGITVAWTSTKPPADRSPWIERLIAGLRRLLRSLLQVSARPQARLLRHVETLSLGGKRSLYLVECDGERFLVAAGGDSLSAPVPLAQQGAAQGVPVRSS